MMRKRVEILNIMGNMQRHESNCTYLKIITRIERQKTFIMCFEMVFGLCMVWMWRNTKFCIHFAHNHNIHSISTGIKRINMGYERYIKDNALIWRQRLGKSQISLLRYVITVVCLFIRVYLFCMMTDKDWLDIFDIMAHINEIWHFRFFFLLSTITKITILNQISLSVLHLIQNWKYEIQPSETDL